MPLFFIIYFYIIYLLFLSYFCYIICQYTFVFDTMIIGVKNGRN